MYYHNITSDDMVNGDGLRVVLWVSGCEHACQNCHNPVTWCPTSGIPFTEWDQAEFFQKLSQEHIDGCTFSGGDPLYPSNRAEIGHLAALVKKLLPTKDIWLYTGYSLSYEDNAFVFKDDEKKLEPFSLDWLQYIDVLVDGRFIQSVRNQDIHDGKKVYWRGSSNQNVIDVQQSLLKKQVILRKGDEDNYDK